MVSQRGWMADFGEYLPTDAVLHAGDPAAVHNLYPEMWATANRRAIRDAGMEGQVAFFSRSASARSPGQATLFWMGDQLVTYDSCDGMQSALMGMLSGGLCGLSMSHSDIGGYTMVHAALKGHQFEYLRTQELLLRWMEFSAFSDALFRSHVGNLPNQSAQVYSSNQTLAHFASFARVHSALGPYRRALMQEAASAGAPLTRHPWLHYPADSTASELSAQFMMGEHLMVAPVFQPNASMVKVYLPDPLQRWQHWSNSTEYPGGGWYEVAAPVGSPAVFATTEFAAGDVWRAVCSVLRELNHADPQAQAEEWIA